MGTREHIIAYLTEVSELYDVNGMASTQLAAAVGYPGSSVAFAQLLSGMERSGLIERDVRGKRTYRISLGSARAVGMGGTLRTSAVPGVAMAPGAGGVIRAPGVARGPGGPEVGDGGSGVGDGGSGVTGVTGIAGIAGIAGASGVGSGIGAAGFDYDELARRLLVQVVRRLAATEPEPGPRSDSTALPETALQETVSGLEYELATAWTKHGKLAEENVRLREQLKAAQRSLALAAERVRRLPASSELDRSEVVLLQRLLTSGGADEPADSGSAVDSGQGELEEARSGVG